MVIRTFEHEYPVIGIKEQTEQYDTYICRDAASKGLCSVISIKDSSLFPMLVSWLTDIIDTETFTDHREHFIYNGQLCIVMRYTQGISLSTKLSTESVPFRERLEIGRRLLERVILQDIPDYFLSRCFVPDQIMIGPDLSVSFNYPLEDILLDRNQDGRANIESVFRLLFDHEIMRKVPDLLMDFMQRLPDLTGQKMTDLYSEYYILLSKLENYSDSDELPKTFWYRLWDKIKRCFKVLKKFLIFLLIIAALIYLIYIIIDPNKNKNSSGHFTSIGTVSIENTG